MTEQTHECVIKSYHFQRSLSNPIRARQDVESRESSSLVARGTKGAKKNGISGDRENAKEQEAGGVWG